MITQERLKELLNYDPDTGVFVRRVPLGRVKAGDKAGCCRTNADGKSYIQIGIDGKLYLAHRLVWLYIHGHFPIHQIDHIKGDGTDNRLSNLRSVTGVENGKNQRLHSNNTSGVCGVYWLTCRRKWHARIMINSKNKHLGYFVDIQDAVAARKEADIKYGYHQNHGAVRPL